MEMNEVRDNVKLALPFLAGSLSYACLSSDISYAYFAAGTSMLMLTTFMLLNLWRIRKNGFTRPWNMVFLCLMGFSAGFCIHAVCELTDLTRDPTSGGFFEQVGNTMQGWIDSIDFRSRNTNAIIKALLTGNRRDIPSETLNAFRTSGASHILALSGLHLGIIYMIVSRLLSVFNGGPGTKLFRSVACISLCTIYSFATGAGASIIRALIFIIVRETGTLLHRPPDLKTTIASSLIIHLTIFPQDVSSIGFQLSYAAIAGIAWIHPWLESLWLDGEEKTLMRRIWESASVSISCQLTTGPLAWHYFGTFPQYFMLTNLIALPLTAIIIPASLLTMLLHAIGICPMILIHCTEKLIDTLCWTLSVIASI
jgi:ComEC/Rec2-related protein